MRMDVKRWGDTLRSSRLSPVSAASTPNSAHTSAAMTFASAYVASGLSSAASTSRTARATPFSPAMRRESKEEAEEVGGVEDGGWGGRGKAAGGEPGMNLRTCGWN